MRDLADAISTAAAELQREMESMSASKSGEFENFVDIYAQASSTIAAALASGGFWLEKIKVSLCMDAPYRDIASASRAPTDG